MRSLLCNGTLRTNDSKLCFALQNLREVHIERRFQLAFRKSGELSRNKSAILQRGAGRSKDSLRTKHLVVRLANIEPNLCSRQGRNVRLGLGGCTCAAYERARPAEVRDHLRQVAAVRKPV